MKSLKDTNYAFKKHESFFGIGRNYYVKSVWNAFNISGAYAPYVSFLNNKNFKPIWKTFESNELGDRNIFL